MRAELVTLQQMLTPEAAAVLTRSIEEARRRRHGQTTPLHVAAQLLAAPSGLLRRSCAVSHPLVSSHPLRCRALDLCFCVALDRLPANANLSGPDAEQPPLSNALVAAVKRAQAHQRRSGCPDQQLQLQQAPLLEVKVELGQLVVSILDDPSVSRIMREAGFSSPDVKAVIEQSPSSRNSATAVNSPATRNVYISPRLQQQQGRGEQEANRRKDVKKVLGIMTSAKNRNPVLVGDSDAALVMKEVLKMIETKELGMDTPATLRLAQVVSLEKEFMSVERSLIPRKINELYGILEPEIRACCVNGGMGGLVLDLGHLKWLVESPVGNRASSVQQQQIGRAAVTEMGRLLARLQEGHGNGSRVWVVGTATCTTYLRCQVYHPTMEGDWDLQAVPIVPPSLPVTGLLPRSGGNGSLSSSIAAVAPPKLSSGSGVATVVVSRPLESTNCSQKPILCHRCMESYQLELAKIVSNEFEDHSSEPRNDSQGTLPQWLQIAVSSRKPASDHLQTKEQKLLLHKKKAEELMRKWYEECSSLHMNPHANVVASVRHPVPSLPMLSSTSHTIYPPQLLEPRLAVSGSISPPRSGFNLNSLGHQISPVKTDLVLGLSQPPTTPFQKSHNRCVQFDIEQSNIIPSTSDTDSLKRLLKGLTEEVSWQPEAASAIATAVMRCKSGNGKLHGIGSKAYSWLLFTGPDKVGKRKMASALSDLLFSTAPIRIHLSSPSPDGDDEESDVSSRGKTLLDLIAEAIQQNPFSVIVLQDIDHANNLVWGAIKRAIESGRLMDSRGREVSLGSIIFILISDWPPVNLQSSENFHLQYEDRILNSSSSGWQWELSVWGKSRRKRNAEWLSKDDQPMKRRKQSCTQRGLSLDLNLAVGTDDDDEEGSLSSSDLTVEHEHKYGQLSIDCPTSSHASELIHMMDETIVFKSVDSSTVKKKVSESISPKFARIKGNGRSLLTDEDALDRIVGGVWQGGATNMFDEWADRVLAPSINQPRSNSDVNDGSILTLSSVKGGKHAEKGSCAGNELPDSISIATDGA